MIKNKFFLILLSFLSLAKTTKAPASVLLSEETVRGFLESNHDDIQARATAKSIHPGFAAAELSLDLFKKTQDRLTEIYYIRLIQSIFAGVGFNGVREDVVATEVERATASQVLRSIGVAISGDNNWRFMPSGIADKESNLYKHFQFCQQELKAGGVIGDAAQKYESFSEERLKQVVSMTDDCIGYHLEDIFKKLGLNTYSSEYSIQRSIAPYKWILKKRGIVQKPSFPVIGSLSDTHTNVTYLQKLLIKYDEASGLFRTFNALSLQEQADFLKFTRTTFFLEKAENLLKMMQILFFEDDGTTKRTSTHHQNIIGFLSPFLDRMALRLGSFSKARFYIFKMLFAEYTLLIGNEAELNKLRQQSQILLNKTQRYNFNADEVVQIFKIFLQVTPDERDDFLRLMEPFWDLRGEALLKTLDWVQKTPAAERRQLIESIERFLSSFPDRTLASYGITTGIGRSTAQASLPIWLDFFTPEQRRQITDLLQNISYADDCEVMVWSACQEGYDKNNDAKRIAMDNRLQRALDMRVKERKNFFEVRDFLIGRAAHTTTVFKPVTVVLPPPVFVPAAAGGAGFGVHAVAKKAGVNVHEAHVTEGVKNQLRHLKGLGLTVPAWEETFPLIWQSVLGVQIPPETKNPNSYTPEELLMLTPGAQQLALMALDRLNNNIQKFSGSDINFYGYDDYRISYQDLINMIFHLVQSIKNPQEKNEALKTFTESLSNMIENGSFVCGTGQVTRALQSLHPYFPRMKLVAAEPKLISNNLLDTFRHDVQKEFMELDASRRVKAEFERIVAEQTDKLVGMVRDLRLDDTFEAEFSNDLKELKEYFDFDYIKTTLETRGTK